MCVLWKRKRDDRSEPAEAIARCCLAVYRYHRGAMCDCGVTSAAAAAAVVVHYDAPQFNVYPPIDTYRSIVTSKYERVSGRVMLPILHVFVCIRSRLTVHVFCVDFFFFSSLLYINFAYTHIRALHSTLHMYILHTQHWYLHPHTACMATKKI